MLLLKDLEWGEQKWRYPPPGDDSPWNAGVSVRGREMRIRPSEKELITGLSLIAPKVERDFLVELINHWSEEIRLIVQNYLRTK